MTLRATCRLCGSVYEIVDDQRCAGDGDEKRCDVCGVGMTDCAEHPVTAFRLLEAAPWPEVFFSDPHDDGS